MRLRSGSSSYSSPVLAMFAASNREAVAIALWPLPLLVELPLYLPVLAALLLGFLFGAFSAWIAARRGRRELRRRGRRIASLERELAATQAQLAPRAGDSARRSSAGRRCGPSAPTRFTACSIIASLVEALRAMFRDGCEVPPRHHHSVAVPDAAAGTLLLMPAWQAGRHSRGQDRHGLSGQCRRSLPAVLRHLYAARRDDRRSRRIARRHRADLAAHRRRLGARRRLSRPQRQRGASDRRHRRAGAASGHRARGGAADPRDPDLGPRPAEGGSAGHPAGRRRARRQCRSPIWPRPPRLPM